MKDIDGDQSNKPSFNEGGASTVTRKVCLLFQPFSGLSLSVTWTLVLSLSVCLSVYVLSVCLSMSCLSVLIHTVSNMETIIIVLTMIARNLKLIKNTVPRKSI